MFLLAEPSLSLGNRAEGGVRNGKPDFSLRNQCCRRGCTSRRNPPHGLVDQRARGLMWLELAKDGAPDPKDQWIRDLYQRDFLVAGDDDRLAAARMREARARGASRSLPARSSVASSLQPFGTLPPDK